MKTEELLKIEPKNVAIGDAQKWVDAKRTKTTELSDKVEPDIPPKAGVLYPEDTRFAKAMAESLKKNPA